MEQRCIDAACMRLHSRPRPQIALLENVRFYKEEEKNEPEFAKKVWRRAACTTSMGLVPSLLCWSAQPWVLAACLPPVRRLPHPCATPAPPRAGRHPSPCAPLTTAPARSWPQTRTCT